MTDPNTFTPEQLAAMEAVTPEQAAEWRAAVEALGYEHDVPEGIELEDFVGVPIDGFAELSGRLVLIEFFAYW